MRSNQLRDRVKKRLAHLGVSPIKAAMSVGLERNFIRDLVKGSKETISSSKQQKLAAALNLSVAELMGENSVSRASDITSPSSVDVPEMDVRVGAGYAGGIADDENVAEDGQLVSRDSVRAHWGIPGPFLRDELHVQPGRVHILAVRGDSMSDALFDGDRALIDLDDTDVSQGGIFAIKDDNGSIIVKQIELVRGPGPRRIRCKSRNPSYDPFELLLVDPVRILGRVACKITRL